MNWSNKWPSDNSFSNKLKQSIEAEVGCKPEELIGATPEIIGWDLAKGDDLTIAKITFMDGQKRRTIDVIVVGDLALDYDDNGWNIYHVPTKACFSKAVPSYKIHTDDCLLTTRKGECNCSKEDSYLYDRDQLLSWMKRVQENYSTSWQMLRLLTPETYKDKGVRAKEIIREWCLSVPVN